MGFFDWLKAVGEHLRTPKTSESPIQGKLHCETCKNLFHDVQISICPTCNASYCPAHRPHWIHAADSPTTKTTVKVEKATHPTDFSKDDQNYSKDGKFCDFDGYKVKKLQTCPYCEFRLCPKHYDRKSHFCPTHKLTKRRLKEAFSEDSPEPPDYSGYPTRCAYCGQGTGGVKKFICTYCNQNYCDSHQLPENHDCKGNPQAPPGGFMGYRVGGNVSNKPTNDRFI